MKPILVACIGLIVTACSIHAQAVVNWPGGRLAISSDGNAHDKDDIGGTPMSIAILYSAGLADKLVHVDYANHFVHQGHDGAASKPDMLQEMILSSGEGARRFGLASNRVFNCKTELAAATTNFVKEALRSSVSDPLWFICSGPMTAANQYLAAVKAADADKLQFIHCVSHSANNGKHDPELSWERMKQDYPTVKYHVIPNQNSAGGEQGLNSPLEHWQWLKNSTNANLAWLYTRNRTATVNEGKFDVSDAGMVYYVISGVGNARAGVAEFRDLLEHPRVGGK